MNEVIKNKAPRIDPKSLKIPASGDYTAENISGSGPPESNIHGKGNEPKTHDPTPDFFLDNAEPLDPEKFPNQATGNNGKNLPTTIPNIGYLLAEMASPLVMTSPDVLSGGTDK